MHLQISLNHANHCSSMNNNYITILYPGTFQYAVSLNFLLDDNIESVA